MKTAMLGAILGLFIAVSATTSCTINHRSDQYACTKNSDCDPGRTCSDGFCISGGNIIADAPKGDAPKSPDGGNACPSQCTSCNSATKSCVIDCSMANGACNEEITCPAGFKCDIRCNSEGACRKGINCLQAASCQIACASRQSCEDVVCGPGACSLTCNGVNSCRDVSCGNSCACDVTCTGSQSCLGVQCSSLACRSGLGCSSASSFCHSCM